MEPLAANILYLAPTRPAMRFGVPAEGFWLNVGGIFYLVPLLTGGVMGWLIALPIHLVMRALAAKNPNFAREIMAWFRTRLAMRGATLWCLPAEWGSRRPSSV